MKALVSTVFLGMPLVAWGGLVVLAVLIIQILVGTRVLPINFKYHKYIAFTLLGLALIHASAALIYVLG